MFHLVIKLKKKIYINYRLELKRILILVKEMAKFIIPNNGECSYHTNALTKDIISWVTSRIIQNCLATSNGKIPRCPLFPLPSLTQSSKEKATLRVVSTC